MGGGALAAPQPGDGASGQRTMPPSWRTPGGEFSNYGQPSPDGPIRWVSTEPGAPGTGVAWTPLHELEGTLVPNGLHFERHHAGIPALDSQAWHLVVEGRVTRPSTLDLATLLRMPRHSRQAFIECAGNSSALWRPEPVQAPVGWLHGLVSCSEWTGVSLRQVLDRVGVAASARWLIAEGLDAAGMTVSLPLDSLPAHSMIALYQNGEPLRAAHGFPARLMLPGLEGVVQVKWLGRLTLSDRPAMSRFDTVAYTDLQADGVSHRFTRTLGVKSLITSPFVGQRLPCGAQELSGLAWSGAGAITRVDITVDGGRRWWPARLDGAARDRAFTRFRATWPRGVASEPAVIASRAVDSAGRVQPRRREMLRRRGGDPRYHYNAVTALSVSADGGVAHGYLDE